MALDKGDHVIFSFIYMCGKCRFCVSGRPVLCLEQGKALTTPLEGTPRTRDKAGKPLNIFSGCGVMAEYATLSTMSLIKLPANVPVWIYHVKPQFAEEIAEELSRVDPARVSILEQDKTYSL